MTEQTNTENPSKTACSWPDGQQIAVSLTYDDALPVHYEIVVPLLNQHGLKATFYLTIKGDPLLNPEEWRRVAQFGHELGNHSLFHPCRRTPPENFSWLEDYYDLTRYTPGRLRDELSISNLVLYLLDGKHQRTYGNTCCHTTIGSGDKEVSMDPILMELFESARGPMISLPVDVTSELKRMQLGHYSGDGQTFDEIRAEIDRARRAPKPLWLIYMMHGVGEKTHPLFIDTEEHQKLIRWLGENKDTVWTAPMVEVSRYIRRFQSEG